jgi:hypothetical protein
MIKELQIVLELSLKIISTLRKGMGSRLAVENNIFGKMSDLEESLSHFYQVEKVAILYLSVLKINYSVKNFPKIYCYFLGQLP